MRWSMWWLGAVVGVGGCLEGGVAEGESHGVLAVVGSFERGVAAGEWIGVEQAESVSEHGESQCVWQRDLVGIALAMEGCADCELDLQVTEVQAADGMDLCGDDDVLHAGVQLSFVPRRIGSSVGSVRVDYGEGPQAMGTAVFEGDVLTWRRLVWLAESSAEPAGHQGGKDLQAPPLVVGP